MLLFHLVILTIFVVPYVGEALFYLGLKKTEDAFALMKNDLRVRARQAASLPDLAEALREDWIRDGMQESLLTDGFRIANRALVKLPRAARRDANRVREQFLQLWAEEHLDRTIGDRAAGIIVSRLHHFYGLVGDTLERAVDDLGKTWDAKGVSPTILSDVEATLLEEYEHLPQYLGKEISEVLSKRLDTLGPCGAAKCEDRRLVSLLLGFRSRGRWFEPALAIFLLLYNMLRAFFTYRVSGLREAEDRSGYTPKASEYAYIARIHRYVPLYYVIAIGALIWHFWMYLIATSVSIPL